MAKTDRYRSPEEAERLADLKRSINLPALATERYGLTLEGRLPSDTNASIVLVNKAQNDRITMKMDPQGYHTYYNHNNDKDNGSVVDFLQNRHPGMNIGQVKGMMQDMVPGARAALDQEKWANQQVARQPNATEERYQAMPASERREAMVRDTTGPKLELTDSSYLQERGLTKETLNDPAFKGRVFTDQHPDRQHQHNTGFPFYNDKGIQSWELRNRAPEGETDSFKMVMKSPVDGFGAKNGVWSSTPTEGKGTQVERMVIGESPIDMMSKYQTERAAKGAELENTRYVATGGPPSIEQKAIIQNVIDREQPKQVVLANDNDAAGQAFNARYLNDLRPPVAALPADVQQQEAATRERLSWIASTTGKGDEKLLTMTITLRNEVPVLPGAGLNSGPDAGGENAARDTVASAREGRKFVEELRDKAAARGLPSEEPEVTNGVGLQMRRNAPGQTEVVLRVPPAQATEIVDLARELRQDREATLPLEARTPENYFVVEKANGKDYNQDILQGRADAQLEAARERAGFTVAPAQEVVATPEVAAAPEREIAVVRVLDSERLPEGVTPPDNRFRSLADEVRTALEETGVQVTATPLPSFDRGPIQSTELEFDYTSGSASAVAAQQVLANAQANSDNRISVAGIEPAESAQADSRFHIGLPLAYAPVALAVDENDGVLRGRLAAAELEFVPTQVEEKPGYLVMLDRTDAREAAVLERIIDLHENETGKPVTVLQSEETSQVRQAGVDAYYEPELGNNKAAPAITGVAILLDEQLETERTPIDERLRNVGATVTIVPPTEAELEVGAPNLFYRVEYPLDNAAVTANVARLLNDTKDTGEATITSENNYDFKAREELRVSGEERRARIEDELQASVLDANPAQPTISRVVQDPEQDYTKLGYPGSATVAVGYPGTEDRFSQLLVEAGATRIERPVSELAPEGTHSYSYPLDQPAVVARVSDVLDGINTIAQIRNGSGVDGADQGPTGVFELPAYQATRKQAYLAVEEQTVTPQVYADINMNGATSVTEILQADSNKDGVVTNTELDNARFEVQAAKDRELAEQTAHAEAERQAAERRRAQEREAAEGDEAQRTSTARSAALAQSEQAAVETVMKQAAIIIFDAEALPAGTLAENSATLQPFAQQVKSALESNGAEVNERQYRDRTTDQPATMLSFAYGENTPQHQRIQETLSEVLAQEGTKAVGITAAAGEVEREGPRLERTMTLHEQPLAIALDAPNPLLESQLRATGATVIPETVQDRPGLVVVLDTQKGEQLAGVEATLSKLPAGAQVVEAPEAAEMRQQMTQTYRQQGGVTPTLQGEAFVSENRQPGLADQLREAGATVAPAVAANAPELPGGAMAVRYPLDQPEVVGRVSVVLDTVNNRSEQLALTLGEAPGAATGGVVETQLAQLARQTVAREQGMEAAPVRELPAAQESVDRTIARPAEKVIADVAQEAAAAPKVEVAAPTQEAGNRINLEAGPHPIERRIVLDIRDEENRLAPTLEGIMSKSGFKVQTAPLEAVGEEKAGTRLEATYRITDDAATRGKQAGVIKNIANMPVVTMHEPEGQAQERDLASKAPGKPEPGQMVAAGQTLRANITVLEVGPEPERSKEMWKDFKNAGAKVGDIGKVDMEEAGTKYSFPVQYAPGDARLPKINALLDSAGRADGVQVTESDNMRLERMARTGAREAKALSEMSPEQRDNYEKPKGKEYPASRPDAYQQVALTDDSLKTAGGMKTLKEDLKATGADVAVQALDGRPAGSGTVQLSYLANHPKVEAVEDVLRDFAGKGGHVYDVKAGADFEAGRQPTPAQVLASGPTAAQEHEANQAEIRSLEARRDALLESQREVRLQSALNEAKIQTPEATAIMATAEREGTKAWVGFGPDLRGEDLKNTDATGMDLKGANLAGQDLRTTDLQDSDLRGANLTGVDLRGANLTNVRLEGAVMDGADLEKAFRVVENPETGRRQIEDGLTAAKLTAPEQAPEGYEPAKEPRLAQLMEDNPRELATATATVEAAVAAPQVAVLEAPAFAGLELPTEDEIRLRQPVQQPQPAQGQPEPQGQPEAQVSAAASVEATQPGQSQPEVQPAQPEVQPAQPEQPAPAVAAEEVRQPAEAPVLTLTAEPAVISLPTADEQLSLFPAAGPVVELPNLAPAAGPEEVRQQATAEAVGLEAPAAPQAAPGSLTRYEELEEAGTALHVVTIHITQPTWTEESGVAVADMPDRVKEVQERLAATGAEVTLDHGTKIDEAAKTETSTLSLVYAHDDKELPAVHKALNEVAEVPAGSDYSVRVEDANAPERAATVEARLENTPEAAKALAAELHDGDPTTARLLIQRPALEDVWALEEAGAKVERIYLPEGPAAQVSYPANEPGVTSAISIELDRIDRDSALTRPPHNSHEREISGPLLGEDPTQQERRQAMAEAEGMKLEPQARYELHEMAERDARAKSYFQEETVRPTDPMAGKLANGEQFEGSLTEVLRLEKPDRDALEASWKAEKTTLLLVVQETPELRVADGNQPAGYPDRVAEALREAGAEAQVKGLGISPDTGLDKHLVAVTFENSNPELARIQATLNRLADQDGVQVPVEGYWQREAILGPNGSRMAEPVLAERERPWLEAVVAVQEPTQQERRELTRAGARVEDTTLEGNENKPAILVYYDLDNPTTVARVSPALDRAEAEGRLLGEAGEARDARGGRVEQYQNDIRLEKEQSAGTWEKHSQQFPKPEAKFETEPTENALPMSFVDRLRSAVNEQLADLRKGIELASPENIAIYEAEQRGIADRLNAPQKEAEKAAYDRGFQGPAIPVAPTAEAEKAAGITTAGSAGTSAEVLTDKVLRERRDDERTIPVVTNGPVEGKVLETTEQVKPGIAATPEKGPDAKPAAPAEAEKAPASASATAEIPAVTPDVAAAAVKAQQQEWQHGIIGMEGNSKRTADERMELVRGALLTSGATVGNVVRSNEDNKMATLDYSYNPQSPDLAKINKVLTDVHSAKPSLIQEEPHSLHQPDIKPHAHEVPREHWPEREGQFNKAHIVVDDFDHTGRGRADKIKNDLGNEGAIVGEIKKDGHGHVEMDVTYHSHTPNIEKINNTLDRAGNSNGIEVQELDSDRSARYQGAMDLRQNKAQEKEREQGE